MQSVTFAIDESGAKGYSDTKEQFKGELGVVAGVLIPEENVCEISSKLEKLSMKYKTDGKLHITDLKLKHQTLLRKEIFKYLRSKKVPWAYEATYVKGYQHNAQCVESMFKKLKENRRSNIKISGNMQRDLLHVELLVGAFSKAVAFCVDNLGTKVYLKVITDRMNKSMIKAFQKGVEGLLNVGEKRVHKVTGYDPEENKVLTGAVSTEIGDGLNVLGDFSGVSYDISVSDSPLTLAADVIANSVSHHLISRQKDNLGFPLNTMDAISGHDLADLVYGVSVQDTDSLQISDTIFQYP